MIYIGYYLIKTNKDTNYSNLYNYLEKNGSFIFDKNGILFNNLSFSFDIFETRNIFLVEINKFNPIKYKSDDNLINNWLSETLRERNINKRFSKAEKEKQDDLRVMYKIIKDANEIIRKGELDIEGKD